VSYSLLKEVVKMNKTITVTSLW